MKTYSKARHMVAAALLASAISPVSADSIDNIVVSATCGDRGDLPLPISTTVLSEDDIALIPATSIDDLLRGVTGVQLPLSSSGYNFPANPSVSIRDLGLGDNGTRTLVLVDGTPANGGFFGTVYWNRVPVTEVERIEVIRGGSSGTFGGLAQSGLINIVTKKPGDTPRLNLEARGGQFGYWGVDVSGSAAVTDQIAVSAYGVYEDSDGFRELVAEQRGPIDQKTSYENARFGGSTYFTPSEGLTLFVRGNFYDQNQGGLTPQARSFTRVWDITTGADWKVNDAGQVEVRAFYQDERFQTFNASGIFGRTADELRFTSVSESEDIGGSISYQHDFGGFLRQIVVGVDGRFVDGENDAQTFEAFSGGALFLDETNFGKQRDIGLFAEASFVPVNNLEILINIREDFYKNHDGSEIENGVSSTLPNNSFEFFSFRTAVRYQLHEAIALRGAAYRSFRAPTLSELYRSFGSSFFQGLSNPELEEEKTLGGEIGIELSGPFGTYLEANVFQSRVKNFVGTTFFGFLRGTPTVQNTNLGEIRSRGIELIGSAPLGDYLNLDLGYTYLDGEVRENPDDIDLVDTRIEGAPEHVFTWGLSLDNWNGFSGYLRGRTLSSQFQFAGNDSPLDKHVVVDLGLSYQVSDHVEVFFKGENLFDEDYAASNIRGSIQRGTPVRAIGGIRIGL